MQILIIALLITALLSSTQDRDYIRYLEKDNHTKEVIIKYLEGRVRK